MELAHNRFQKLCSILALLGIALQVFWSHIGVVSTDIIWANEAARRMAEGGTYALDFFENNPPLIFYLHRLSRGIAALFAIEPVNMWYGWMMIGASCSFFYVCNQFYQITRSYPTSLINGLVMALWFGYFVVPISGFGQREQVMMILGQPYFFSIMLRCFSQKLSELEQQRVQRPLPQLFRGFLAAVGLALKPHFFFVPIFLELFLLKEQKTIKAWLRLDILAMLSFFLGYAFCIYHFTPDYFSVIFSHAVLVYYNFQALPWQAILVLGPVLYVYIVLIFGFIAAARAPDYRKLIHFLLLYMVGFMLTYVVQRKGWTYHAIPMLQGSALAVIPTFIALNTVRRQNIKYSITHGIFCFELLMAFVLLEMGQFPAVIHSRLNCVTGDYTVCYAKEIVNLVEKGILKGSYLPLTQNMGFSMKTLYYGNLKLASRFPNYWMITATEHQKEPAAMKWTREMMIEDFYRFKPQAILIDDCFKINAQPFYHYINFIAFLKKDPRFNSIWQQYSKVEHKDRSIAESCLQVYVKS